MAAHEGPGAPLSAVAGGGVVEERLALRLREGARFFGSQADAIARTCEEMAARFVRGGRLVALGRSPQGASDARHVAVEFVHPVIVGKRALPALAVVGDGAELLVEPDDIVLAFEPDRALEVAAERGCLLLAPDAQVADPFLAQELVETLYHLWWELVHVFLDRRSAGASEATDPGASAFLYPFLGERADDLESVRADVAASVRMKAEELGALRAQTLREGADELLAAAHTLRERLDAGATVLALGNGGSATDAMDAVADLQFPPGPWPARRALDLAADPAILTAIANDVGAEQMFVRQVIAYGRPGDVLLCFSTSGSSGNVVAALREARSRGLATVAFVGYDGGPIAADRLADHVIVSRSQHIPRIQEAQATAWHVLRELVEEVR